MAKWKSTCSLAISLPPHRAALWYSNSRLPYRSCSACLWLHDQLGSLSHTVQHWGLPGNPVLPFRTPLKRDQRRQRYTWERGWRVRQLLIVLISYVSETVFEYWHFARQSITLEACCCRLAFWPHTSVESFLLATYFEDVWDITKPIPKVKKRIMSRK